MGSPEIDFRALGKRGGLTTAATHDMRRVAANAPKSAPSNFDYWRQKITERFGELDPSDRDARAAQSHCFSNLAQRSASNRRRNKAEKSTSARNGTRRSPKPET
jgi:hypothetical protein